MSAVTANPACPELVEGSKLNYRPDQSEARRMGRGSPHNIKGLRHYGVALCSLLWRIGVDIVVE